MYEGNEPCRKGHELVTGGYTDVWQCMYGGGELDEGRIIHATFEQDRKVQIFICGDYLQIIDNRYTGSPEVWGYCNKQNTKTFKHRLEPEKIEKILSKDYNCKFWELVQKRAKELYATS